MALFRLNNVSSFPDHSTYTILIPVGGPTVIPVGRPRDHSTIYALIFGAFDFFPLLPPLFSPPLLSLTGLLVVVLEQRFVPYW